MMNLLRRIAVLALICAGMAGCRTTPELPRKGSTRIPEVLAARGFGDPSEPVTILWGSMIEGMESAVTFPGSRDPVPAGSKWVFQDPAPVWRCFADVETRTFDMGMLAFSTASMVLRSGTGKGRIAFHSTPRSASVLAPEGRPEGGHWTFDPVVTERLVRLLNATVPAEVGVRLRRGRKCVYIGQSKPKELVARAVTCERDWLALETNFGSWSPRHAGERLKIPSGFDWRGGLAVVAWLPPQGNGASLRYGNARMAGSILKWDIRWGTKRKKGAVPSCPAVAGLFSLPARATSVQIWLDGKMALEVEVEAEG